LHLFNCTPVLLIASLATQHHSHHFAITNPM